MHKVEVSHHQRTGTPVLLKGQPVTIVDSHMIEKSGGNNVTMVKVVNAQGETFEVNSRSLKVVR